MNMKRRDFLKAAGVGLGVAGFPGLVLGTVAARVVVVGGGTGGASVARYIKRANATIDVTLIEPNAIYHTCYMSNEVLSGDRDISHIQAGYEGLEAQGINVVHDFVVSIDPEAKSVTTASGEQLPYDRCVVSPGIDFKWEAIEGYDEGVAERIPHAWKAGNQTSALRSQLEAMDDGGTVIIAPPDNPFRCPPGPYERISQIAHYLKTHNPTSKILVLDAKTSFAKKAAFELGWERLYGYGSDNSMIDWLPGDPVTALDETSGTVTTRNGFSYQGDVINLIPNQKAGRLAFDLDLTEGEWCPVDLRTFESTRYPGIHVIGDACIGSALPKSGFAANAEAKVCARAVVALLGGQSPETPAFTNTCYSVVRTDYAISVVAMYRLSADGKAIEKVPNSGGVTPLEASATDLQREVGHAHSWYNNFVDDVFG